MAEQRCSEVEADGSSVLVKVGPLLAFVATAGVLFVALFSQGSASATPDSPSVPSAVQTSTQDTGDGESVYAASCASCHQAGGVGVPGTFPPLAGNPNAADPAYVEQVILDGKSGPIDVNGESYDSSMPPITNLSDTEIADVSAYVASLAQSAPTETQPPAEEIPDEGTVAGGEDLFRGSTTFTNGGGACVGCHTAGSIGNLGGPGLGPDLTDSAENLGGTAGLSAWLVNPPSPTMTPIFSEHPLTPAEIADLTTFLDDAPNQEQPSDALDWMLVIAIAGVIVLIAAMAIAYRGMRQTYAERLRTRGRPVARADRRTS